MLEAGSVHDLRDGDRVPQEAGSVHDLHLHATNLHPQGAIHHVPSGLRNPHPDRDEVRSATGDCHEDSLRPEVRVRAGARAVLPLPVLLPRSVRRSGSLCRSGTVRRGPGCLCGSGLRKITTE
jgi:hypothetical protein